MKIGSVTFLIFSYQTENKERIKEALWKTLGNVISEAQVEEVALQGHYGDVITEIKYVFKGKAGEHVFNVLVSKFDKSDVIYLLSTLQDRVDGSKIHIRLDKQVLVAINKLAIKDGDDVVKVVINTAGNVAGIKEELKKVASGDLH
ncbi:MAG: hypothetical protein MPF33_04995 [Candidatus Aramenus sp.]|jgi:RNA binding exosome subunit|nr:hypothetical protein [Candidatus Aramenus sp.]